MRRFCLIGGPVGVEFDECEPELGAESCPDLDFVVRIVRMDTDVVEFIYARLVRLRMLIRSKL